MTSSSVRVLYSCGLYFMFASIVASRDDKLPRIIESLVVKSRIEYADGDKIKLRCPISGLSPFQITWSKDGVFLDDSSSRHYSVIGKHGQILRIKKMNEDDDGFYECKGTNGFGSETFGFSVRQKGLSGVQLLPTKMTPDLVRVGEYSELKCHVKNLGSNDVIRWLKRYDEDSTSMGKSIALRDVVRIPVGGGKNLSFKRLDSDTNKRYRFTNTSVLENGRRIHSFTFEIKETRLSDAGEYVCLVVEPLVDKTFKFNIGVLTVTSALDFDTSGANANRITIWAIVIPLSFLVIVIPLLCCFLCLRPCDNNNNNKNDDSSKKALECEDKSDRTSQPFASSSSSAGTSSRHIYQPLLLRPGPLGKSSLGIPENQTRVKPCCQRNFYSS